MAVATIVSVAIVSCKKYNENNSKSITQDLVAIDMSNLPVYYDGEKTDSFNETKEEDEQIECVVLDTAVFYFSGDSIFGQFCTINQMQYIYEYSHKLDSIYEKAVELGLTSNNDTTIPQEMEHYWNTLMDGIGINSTGNNSKGLLYIIGWDQQFQMGNDRVFFAQNRTTLGNFNNRIESLRIVGLSGFLVGCHKTWWGKPRRWFTIIAPGQFNIPELPNSDRKKFCSYFSVG